MRRYTAFARYPPRNWSQRHDRESSRHRRGTRRLGDRRAAARSAARRWTRTSPSSCCSASPTARSPRWRRAIAPGPWVAHVSGATPLAALDPHARRFGVHPLQTFTRARGAEQLDGALAAVTAETDEAREVGLLARADARARAVRARRREARRSTTPAPRSRRTTSSRCAARPARCSRRAGAPPEALDPLMRRTIENGFELTGPIARGDWATVDAHLRRDPAERARARADVRDARRGDEALL